MVRPIGVGGLPKKTTYLKPIKQRKRDDSIVLSVSVGQTVKHKEYGNGVVVDTDGYSVKVKFKKENNILRSFSYPIDFIKGVLK